MLRFIENKRNSDELFWKTIIIIKDFVFWKIYAQILLLMETCAKKVKWVLYIFYNFNPIFKYSNFKERRDVKKNLLNPDEHKINLSDFTFIIPVRYDSTTRKNNLEYVISFIKKFFDTRIIIAEEDNISRFNPALWDADYLFISSPNKLFHRTRTINYAAKKSTSEFLAIFDSDVLINPLDIYYAAKILREKKVQVVYPYNGDFMDLSEDESKNIISTGLFVKKLNKYNKRLKNAVGGAFMISKSCFIEAGMENENFISWGAEDNERYERFYKLGYNIKRTHSPLFHLYHPRNINGGETNPEYGKNKEEYLRIKKITKAQLLQEIKNRRVIK